MKRWLLALVMVAYVAPVLASNFAEIHINIVDPVKENKYFLCLYGVGCLSIRAGDRGKKFPAMPLDLGNITKFVITDVTDMRMYLQPTVKSCNVMVNAGQKGDNFWQSCC